MTKQIWFRKNGKQAWVVLDGAQSWKWHDADNREHQCLYYTKTKRWILGSWRFVMQEEEHNEISENQAITWFRKKEMKMDAPFHIYEVIKEQEHQEWLKEKPQD